MSSADLKTLRHVAAYYVNDTLAFRTVQSRLFTQFVLNYHS
jgi:hypothetical protein